MPPKPQDLVTNKIQSQIEEAAKILKRSDFQVTVLLRPGQHPRYAIRLGDQPWVKDINLPSTLEIMCSPREEFLQESKETAREIQELSKKNDLINSHACWTVNPPMEVP